MPSQPPQCRAARDQKEGPWLLLIVALLGAAVAGVWQMPERIHSDCALCLEQAELLLDGAVPCCDFVEYQSAVDRVPERTAGAGGAVHWEFLRFWRSTASCCCCWRSQRWRFVGCCETRRAACRPLEARLALLAWVGFYFLVDWHGNVGQREHLFVLFYVPYLMLRVLRHRPGPSRGAELAVGALLAVLLGIQAGLGAFAEAAFPGHRRRRGVLPDGVADQRQNTRGPLPPDPSHLPPFLSPRV